MTERPSTNTQCSIVYMYHNFFIHLFVNGKLGCFHVPAIVNSAAMIIRVHVYFRVVVFSGYIPSSGISGSYEGNGTPLQYSCLENTMDRGAWWAAIYGVAQSWTWLKRLSSSSMVVLFLVFKEISPLFSTVAYQFTLPPTAQEASLFCRSFPVFVVYRFFFDFFFFNDHHLTSVRWYLNVVLHCS